MIDLRVLTQHRDVVGGALEARGVSSGDIDTVISLDAELRAKISSRDDIRASINSLSRQVGELRRAGNIEQASATQQRSREIGETLTTLEGEIEELRARRDFAWLMIPNVPAADVPVGKDENSNVVLKYWLPTQGYLNPEEFRLPDVPDYQKVPHWEIGQHLGILDLTRAAKLSGSMFALFRGDGARLIRALAQFALDSHREDFEEVHPPTLVTKETMTASGNLPKFAEDAYATTDDLYAIPTSEVPLVSLARGEILSESILPLGFTAFTPCFRREAGSAGRDTRGLLRLHEFDKVELVGYSTPADVDSMFNKILAHAELLLQSLGLWYRVVSLCTGDLGQSSARTYDLEVYAPGVDRWLEVSSVSWCSDYQARRANIRYRPIDGGQPRYVHTFNGSALAWPRTIAALLESNRREDGTVLIPEPLRAGLGTSVLERNPSAFS